MPTVGFLTIDRSTVAGVALRGFPPLLVFGLLAFWLTCVGLEELPDELGCGHLATAVRPAVFPFLDAVELDAGARIAVFPGVK